eukprot:4598978-Alexandrium_andersonii.AAC.1
MTCSACQRPRPGLRTPTPQSHGRQGEVRRKAVRAPPLQAARWMLLSSLCLEALLSHDLARSRDVQHDC